MPTGIEGVITVSPVHGGPIRVGVPSSRPLAATEFVVASDSGQAGSFTTDEQGHFHISVPPGHYTVTRKGAGHGIGRYGPFEVYVRAGEATKVEWNCDSGMR